MDLELHGAKTGIRNLKSRLQKLDQESLKSQEIIYSQDFNIAQLERRIARMQGEGLVENSMFISGRFSIQLPFNYSV